MRSIATFDLTSGCQLRCRHCYYFAGETPPDLDDDTFLQKALARRDEYGIRTAFWVGGEPLLRPGLLERALPHFERNAFATGGQVPIPPHLEAGVLVSVDGPEAVHDALRGKGTFRTALRHARAFGRGRFALMVTLAEDGADVVPSIPGLVEEFGALGALVGFVVGKGAPSDASREASLDALARVQAESPGAVLNTPASLEQFRPKRLPAWKDACIYRSRAVAFDTRLEKKEPCTFGADHCASCGCPVIALHLAAEAGDADSLGLLRALFVRRAGPRPVREPPRARAAQAP